MRQEIAIVDVFRRAAKPICTAVALSAFGLSLWACVSVQKLTLSFPILIPVLNVGVSLAGLIFVWFPRWINPKIQDGPTPSCLTWLSYCTALLPFALAVLSTTYVISSDLRACRTELQWDRLFRSKNEVTIRSIQTQLHCCGFNSMRDRAFPFPSQKVDARTCERDSGFVTHCGPLLKQRVLFVATLSDVASILNAVFLLLIASTIPRFLGQNQPCSPSGEGDVRSSLLHSGNETVRDVQATLEEEERRASLRE